MNGASSLLKLYFREEIYSRKERPTWLKNSGQSAMTRRYMLSRQFCSDEEISDGERSDSAESEDILYFTTANPLPVDGYQYVKLFFDPNSNYNAGFRHAVDCFKEGERRLIPFGLTIVMYPMDNVRVSRTKRLVWIPNLHLRQFTDFEIQLYQLDNKGAERNLRFSLTSSPSGKLFYTVLNASR